MDRRQLTVQNASVTTVAIEVKAFMIGARQVTQGIFKQLIEEPLIAEDGALNGVPWGHVTWHPDRCDYHSNRHWHIVWQRGEELRRAWEFEEFTLEETPHGVRRNARHASARAALLRLVADLPQLFIGG
jgi:hypothetical protein